MFRQIASLTGLIPLAVLGMLVSARPAAAQNEGYARTQGAQGSAGNSSWGSNGGWRSRRVFVPRGPIYNDYPPAVIANESLVGSQLYAYRSYDSATINVNVPADASISFDGSMTVQRGEQRQFMSPPLEPGKEYTYDVQVSWKQDGRDVMRKRHITFHAGYIINLTFPVEPAE